MEQKTTETIFKRQPTSETFEGAGDCHIECHGSRPWARPRSFLLSLGGKRALKAEAKDGFEGRV